MKNKIIKVCEKKLGVMLTERAPVCIKNNGQQNALAQNGQTGVSMKAKLNLSKAAFAVLSLAAIGASTTAFAQFRDMDVERADVRQQAPVVYVQQAPQPMHEHVYQSEHSGKVTQIGASKGVIGAVKGFGKQVPLVSALKIVVPGGWNAKKMGAVDTAQLVVFANNGTWVEAVSSFAAQTGNHIIIDWDQRVVTVQGLMTRSVSSEGTIRLATTVAETQKEAVKAPEVKVVAPPPLPKWELVAGRSLRDNVESWAPKANYKVTWQAVNYMIAATAVYQGEFDDDVAGPITAMVKSFECHDVPLKATFMEDNRVLVVENSPFRTSGVCSKTEVK